MAKSQQTIAAESRHQLGTSPCLSPTRQPQNQKEKGPEEEPGNKQVTVSTVKPMDIRADVQKDWMDKLSWVLTGVLVAIGGYGVWYARRTLREIKASGIQTGQMITHAGIQAEAAKQQAESAQKSLALSRDTAQKQLRAYVCIDGAMLRFIGTGDNESFEIQIDIKNYGATPAYGLHWWAHSWIESYPLTVDLPEPPQDFVMSRTILAPGGRTSQVASPGQSIPGTIVILGTPSRTAYVYGKISYRDAFGHDRTTKYRLFYGGNGPPRRKTHAEGFIMGFLQPDIEGNEAD